MPFCSPYLETSILYLGQCGGTEWVKKETDSGFAPKMQKAGYQVNICKTCAQNLHRQKKYMRKLI